MKKQTLQSITLLTFFALGISNGYGQVFSAPTALLSSTGANQIDQIFQAGDFNNDGQMDLIGSTNYESKFQLHINNGSNQFVKSEHPMGNNFTIADLADFDNDGFLDALGSQNIIAQNLGNETLKSLWYPSGSQKEGSRVKAADMNNDGIMDYVSIPQVDFQDVLHWYQGNGDFTFTEKVISNDYDNEFTKLVDFD